jgi:hypothetical protein
MASHKEYQIISAQYPTALGQMITKESLGGNWEVHSWQQIVDGRGGFLFSAMLWRYAPGEAGGDGTKNGCVP